jgi:crotonobetainyl-CoA hydratase
MQEKVLSTIRLEKIGHTLIITLNRPAVLNAVNMQLTNEMDECLRNAENDSTISTIIITGSGRAFSAGADLKEVSNRVGKNENVKPASGFAGFVQAKITKPIIAAVNGLAYGGGFEIALASDLVIASEEATFALPEVKRGIIAAAGGLLRLPRQVPTKIAMKMALTGDIMSAQEMERWGLVNQVVPADEVLPVALEIANRISLNAPVAVRASKKLLYEALDLPLHHSDEAWQLNARITKKVMSSEDAKEGPKAFSEKRSPVWKGH